MTLSSKYKDQVETLLEILPLISSNKNFAIKGGTAINLFLLNLPRLSVDIDLCYVPLSARDQALQEISSFIKELSRRANAIGFKTREKTTLEGYESTLYVRSRKNAEVKVEINLVVRGAVNKPVVKSLVPLAVSMFERNAEILCLDINDLFGGKPPMSEDLLFCFVKFFLREGSCATCTEAGINETIFLLFSHS
jgi:predicted nucleotidyltransferase component of viral defense system